MNRNFDCNFLHVVWLVFMIIKTATYTGYSETVVNFLCLLNYNIIRRIYAA